MKTCSKCKQTKNKADFSNKRGKLQTYCKECNKKYLKEHYQQNKLYYLEKNQNRRKEIREFIRDHKKKFSCDCGESHVACLDFHHIDVKKKDISIASTIGCGWSKDRLIKELEKCIVICSNCHRKLHFGE